MKGVVSKTKLKKRKRRIAISNIGYIIGYCQIGEVITAVF